MLVMMDIKCFFKVLQSQGFDLWLTHASKASYLPPPCVSDRRKDLIMRLEEVRTMVETTLCKESKLVVNLDPNQLRVLCMLESLGGVELNKQSQGYFNDEDLENNYPRLVSG